MEEQPLRVQFNSISSNLIPSQSCLQFTCGKCLFERLWIHSNSIRSSLTGKDYYLGPTNMAQYHLRRTGWEFPFKAHRLPLMMTDLIRAYRHKEDLISYTSRYFIRLLWSYFKPPMTVAQVTKYRLKSDVEMPGRAKPQCFWVFATRGDLNVDGELELISHGDYSQLVFIFPPCL